MLRQTEKLVRQVTAFAAVTAVLGHHTPHIPELCISSNMLSTAYSRGWAKIAMKDGGDSPRSLTKRGQAVA